MGLVTEGIHGNNNWGYSNEAPAAKNDRDETGIEYVFLPIPGTAVLGVNINPIIERISAQIDAIENKWSKWFFEHIANPTVYDDYYAGQAKELDNLWDTITSGSYDFSAYNYCLLLETVPGMGTQFYDFVFEDGPNAYNYCSTSAAIGRMKSVTPAGIVTTSLYAYEDKSINIPDHMLNCWGCPIFDTLQECQDYLFGDVEPEDPTEDPGSTGPGSPSTPIQPSTKIDEVAHTYLSSLTVIAEIDKTNLNYIGESLNNEIDLSQDVGQNLLKIARGIIQGNIADGIISIKSIPIPKGESLPYETGQITTLFEPLGAHPVAGKKLNNFIKKYRIGEMNIEPIYNDFRDYLTEYSIYLPFSGIHRLDADVIVGTKLIIDVDIDFYMGSMLYHIIINDTQTNRDIYQFTGDCAIEMPITSKDYGAKYQAIMNGVFSGVGMVAGGMMGGPAGATAGGMIAGIAGAGLKTAGNAATVKGNYMQTGKLIPNAACKSVLYPYLIVSKPQDVTPNIAPVKGLPCHEVGTLGSYTGFTVATQVNLDNVPYATDEDKEIIRSMLADGVYL